MIITNKIKLDLQNPGTMPTVHAVQNDSYSRNLEITLFADRKPFVFPENGTVVIRYKKSDGKGGEYDTLPDGSVAWWAKQNTLTVALAPQVLTTPGSVTLSVSLIHGGTQLSVFPIRLSVEPIAAAKLAASENYFYITGLLPAPTSGAIGQCLRISSVNDMGRVTAVEAVDHWTIADREAIIQDVIAALGTPVFGSVDSENNIILTGTLADGTYTLKYAYADGSMTTIGTLEHGESTASYTNQIPISTDTDGSIYNGTGYAEQMRISSSGEIKALSYSNTPNAAFLTGFIPVKSGDIIRMKNCFIDVQSSALDKYLLYGNMTSTIYTAFFDSGKTALGKVLWSESCKDNNFFSCTADDDGYVTEFTIIGENVAYIRLNPASNGNPADAIVTVNEIID